MELTCLCASVLGILAYVSASSDEFYFFNSWFRRADDQESCKMCYGENDCLSLTQAKCELYTATSAALADEEGPHDPGQPQLARHVDELMVHMLQRATISAGATECIPFISKYTDCTKENACLGCMSCECDDRGRWTCSLEQHCRREEPAVLDHRALVYAIENLRGDGVPSFRLKRSASTPATGRKHHEISFDEMAEWMFEVKPLKHDPEQVNATTEASNKATPIDEFEPIADDGRALSYNTASDPVTDTDSDYIAFNDVLINIGFEIKNNSGKIASVLDHDYMNLEDINVTYNRDLVDSDNKLEALKVNISRTTTEAISTPKEIDLLDIARRRYALYSSKNETDLSLYSSKKAVFENIENDNYTAYDNSNDIDQWNVVNIMKRDVAEVSLNDKVTPAMTNETENKTVGENVIKELDDGVYQPLNKVIDDKKSELDDLLKIRQKLIDILKLNRTKDGVVLNKTDTSDRNNNSHYSFYNVEILPEPEYDLRRSNTDQLDKLMKTLKRDILTVMKDISLIQKITGRHNISDEIKILLRAMKHFVHKHGKLHTRHHAHEDDDLRKWNKLQSSGKDVVKQYLIEILQAVDKAMPSANALAPLSANSKRVLRRILKTNKMEDFTALGLRVNDRNYNLTNDLKTIGMNWPVMTAKVAKSSPWDKLYNMKLLQIVLESDIYKMNDALALIDFAHSRRMVTLDDDVSDTELLRINTSLRSIHNKIKKIIALKNINKKNEVKKVVNVFTVTQNKKQTFLKHVRDLLKTSKNEIRNLLSKKVTKTEIIKGLAKKKLDEIKKKKLTEYENVMHKWQNNLNVHRRRKRSHSFEPRNIMKNILPKYLRGKVNPKINSRNKTKSKSQDALSKRNRKPHSKRPKHNKRRNTTNSPTQYPSKEHS